MKFFFGSIVALLGLLATTASAQTLLVTSPSTGDFLGSTNQVKFIITGASTQARVVATVINTTTNQSLVSVEGRFDPNADQQVNGTLDLNFSESTPTGTYRLRVENYQAGSVVNTVNVENITIDTRQPKFFDLVPVANSFVRGIVRIYAEIDEANIDRWTVSVNGQTIPNNTGTASTVDVDWDTSGIQNDGQQTISVRVEDKARNSQNRTVQVTLDRVAPVVTVVTPGSTTYRPNATIPVAIDVQDGAEGSVHITGVNVVMRAMDGTFLARVARRAASNSGSTLRWTGRVRNTRALPNQFKMVVTCVDRAGNVANTQEVVVTLAGR